MLSGGSYEIQDQDQDQIMRDVTNQEMENFHNQDQIMRDITNQKMENFHNLVLEQNMFEVDWDQSQLSGVSDTSLPPDVSLSTDLGEEEDGKSYVKAWAEGFYALYIKWHQSNMPIEELVKEISIWLVERGRLLTADEIRAVGLGPEVMKKILKLARKYTKFMIGRMKTVSQGQKKMVDLLSRVLALLHALEELPCLQGLFHPLNSWERSPSVLPILSLI
ncbi:hypothetical protein APHAL10511_004235 [Amanita phalloides]|nr:hypothetical protein APHAL10511_004235 [Amanita phalloides]